MNNRDNMQKDATRFTLDKNRRRVELCPCGKSNNDGKFVPFVGYDDCGYCHSCGEVFYPDTENNRQGLIIHPKPLQVSYVPVEYFNKSLNSYHNDNLTYYLRHKFGSEITERLMESYFINGSTVWKGATIFWQIDIQGKIRTGKIMLYNPNTGRRVKEPAHIDWVHNKLNLPEFDLVQCLFGEHLLAKDTKKPVGIVESEKTAIIASAILPELIWLATGGKDSLTINKCKVLKGRDVILFPDLNAYDMWLKKALDLGKFITGARFTVSDLLDKNTSISEKNMGWDLADFLLSDLNRNNTNPNNTICKN
ncbi:DUF6371 domain-containing protein [Bacteroidota bacterium]